MDVLRPLHPSQRKLLEAYFQCLDSCHKVYGDEGKVHILHRDTIYTDIKEVDSFENILNIYDELRDVRKMLNSNSYDPNERLYLNALRRGWVYIVDSAREYRYFRNSSKLKNSDKYVFYRYID